MISAADQSHFQNLLQSDPEIQAIVQKVWGSTPLNQRPSDTPKQLEAANDQASKQITQILINRGVKLPPHSFINPRTMSLEGEHGWAGLPTAAKIAIIAGVAATGVGAASAAGAFGGAAGAGASGAGAASTGGVTTGLGGLTLPAASLGALPTVAGGGMTTSGIVSSLLGGGSTASKILNAAKLVGPLATGLSAGSQKGRESQNTAASDAANFALRESGQHETGVENRADLELRRKQDARLGQSDSYRKALQGALGMNMQDVGLSGVPKNIPVINFTGGSRPSAIGPEGRAASSELNRQAMAKLMSGESYSDLAPLERTSAPEYKTPGAFENITGALGLAGNAVNSTSAANEQQTFQQKILDALKRLNPDSGGGASAGLTNPQPPYVNPYPGN